MKFSYRIIIAQDSGLFFVYLKYHRILRHDKGFTFSLICNEKIGICKSQI